MACPGGCIMGGGQPRKILKEREGIDVRTLRRNALYSEDKKATFRKSHQNPYVQKVYKEFLHQRRLKQMIMDTLKYQSLR